MKKLLLLSIPFLFLVSLEAKMVRIDKTPSHTAKERLVSSHNTYENSGYYSEMMEATLDPASEHIATTAPKTTNPMSHNHLAITQDPNEITAPPPKKAPPPKNNSGSELNKEVKKEQERGASVKEDDKFYPLSSSRTQTSSSSHSSHSGSYEHTFIKTLSILLVLIILIFVTIWMFRRFSFGKFSTSNSSSKGIRILEKRALSPKTMLYVLEVKGKKTLIAESQLEVKSLMDLEIEEIDPDL